MHPAPHSEAPDFAYRAGELHAEDVAVQRIAEQVGTPFYCYSSAAIERQYRRFAAAFAGQPATICYSIKANSNLAVIATLARLGAGADVVSEGELRRAVAAGIPPGKIIFSGIGKTPGELAFALEQGVRQINVESMPELEDLNRVAERLGKRAPVAIRVNPDVDARTHEKIATGKKENKFGIDLAHAVAAFRAASQMRNIDLVGMAVHIGSQLTALGPFEIAFSRIFGLCRTLREAGIALKRLDLGGGIGIRYHDETPLAIEEYAAMVRRLADGFEIELAFEPGRFIVGNAGVLVSRVLYLKEGVTHRFLIVDAAMNDLLRPALYDSWHAIAPVRESVPHAARLPQSVVGPVCETGDSFAWDRALPALKSGDLVAIFSAGAYGAVMSSSYNTRPLVPEVMVRGGAVAVIRPRPGYEDLLAQDRMAPWLAGG